jgi:hypothetical protein
VSERVVAGGLPASPHALAKRGIFDVSTSVSSSICC